MKRGPQLVQVTNGCRKRRLVGSVRSDRQSSQIDDVGGDEGATRRTRAGGDREPGAADERLVGPGDVVDHGQRWCLAAHPVAEGVDVVSPPSDLGVYAVAGVADRARQSQRTGEGVDVGAESDPLDDSAHAHTATRSKSSARISHGAPCAAWLSGGPGARGPGVSRATGSRAARSTVVGGVLAIYDCTESGWKGLRRRRPACDTTRRANLAGGATPPNEECQMGEEHSLENKAAELLRLHQDPTLLTVVNVWDSISAKVVAETPGHGRAGHGEPRDRRLVGLSRRREDPGRPDDRGGRPHRRRDDAAGDGGPRGRVRRPRRDRAQGHRRRHRRRQRRGPDEAARRGRRETSRRSWTRRSARACPTSCSTRAPTPS